MQSMIRTLLRRPFPSPIGISSIPSRFGTIFHPTARFSSSGDGSGAAGGGDDEKDDAWNKIWNASDQPPSSSTADGLDWGDATSWSTGLTKEHFDGAAVGRQASPSTELMAQDQANMSKELREQVRAMDEEDEMLRMLDKDNKENKAYADGWNDRMKETYQLLKQVREPGARGAYLKDSEKAEMYRLHKENPEVYTVERLAKDYRIMRQRVHAILWLKEMEEEEEKKRGKPLDDSVEILLDNFPEFFNSHDREFHVASLPYKPDFKVMPEGWDGTTRDPDEVLYEISMKEDQMLYEEFVQKLSFNKKKVAGKVKWHRYSRRRPSEGWSFTVEKLGTRDKRGSGGGWKFVSLPDGSSRPLNEMEKLFLKRETPKFRKRIIPPFK